MSEASGKNSPVRASTADSSEVKRTNHPKWPSPLTQESEEEFDVNDDTPTDEFKRNSNSVVLTVLRARKGLSPTITREAPAHPACQSEPCFKHQPAVDKQYAKPAHRPR